MNQPLPGWKDKILFTPGPLTTSRTVKQAMLRDLGSRDTEFIQVVADIRRRLLALGGVSPDDYAAILMQGSGTFGIESVISSSVPQDGKLLVVVNGAYGRRMVQMATILGIDVADLTFSERGPVDADEVDAALNDDEITHVAIVHCETTTGVINPVEAVGERVKRAGKRYIVDAMSSFGAVPLDLEQAGVDYLISSANKCIEGVPGFSFVLARLDALAESEGVARSLSLDLLSQYKGLEANGQFRFTPPTHTLLAFHQALLELEQEGGVAGRARRYQRNRDVTVEGMRKLGFVEYLDEADQGYIITSFLYPDHPNFSFEEFYTRLGARDIAIYPGKVSDADCFRIGHIGRIFEADVRGLLSAVAEVMGEMGVELKIEN